MESGSSDAMPLDPAGRSRLWREWIHLDVPQVDRPRVERRRGNDAPRRDVVDRRHGGTPSARVATSRTSAARIATPPSDWLEEVIDRPAGVVAGLSSAVRESLVGGELPASDRERIVSRAARLGINRFEATLLIATVQHRVRAESGVAPGVETYTIPARASWGVGKLLACVLAAEALIAGAGYLFWTR